MAKKGAFTIEGQVVKIERITEQQHYPDGEPSESQSVEVMILTGSEDDPYYVRAPMPPASADRVRMRQRVTITFEPGD
jgi:hypothetical protein